MTTSAAASRGARAILLLALAAASCATEAVTPEEEWSRSQERYASLLARLYPHGASRSDMNTRYDLRKLPLSRESIDGFLRLALAHFPPGAVKACETHQVMGKDFSWWLDYIFFDEAGKVVGAARKNLHRKTAIPPDERDQRR